MQLVHWDHMVEMLVEVVEEDKLAPDWMSQNLHMLDLDKAYFLHQR